MSKVINKVFNKSCTHMNELQPNQVDLVVTSPPYFNLKEYSSWDTYEDHLDWLKIVFTEVYRVMRPGSWICWNIQECLPNKSDTATERMGCHPLLADTICIMREVGFWYEKDIIWYKGKGTATQKLFGSYPNPSLLLISGLTEHIITARKPMGKKPARKRDPDIVEKSKITKEEWGAWAVDFWEIPPVPSSYTKHPAPYPVELAERCIRLNSFVDDLVLDPFMGSGTTALAAQRAKRNYVGYELNEDYIESIQSKLDKNTDLFADV